MPFTAPRPLLSRQARKPDIGLKLGLCLALFVGLVTASPARAQPLTGPIEKIDNGGAIVVIQGKAIAVSGARSNICIGGVCDQPRSKLKSGLTCAADVVSRDGKLEARRLSCK